ncbi:hypothetical protein HZB97_00945, partial [Candidatus Gottesmanbacteria bacterium]|nr:hypothetical protein [Candidatus Gottesmanbacteria bacterium]
LILATSYLLLLIKPAWTGELGGTFKAKEIPQEYTELKNFLVSQPEFFRTFWIPKKQRFGFYNNNHPALSAQEIFATSELPLMVEKLKSEETKQFLSLSGVKYVILPYDSEGEFFLEDRKYNPQLRQNIEEELDKIPWLKKIFSSYSNDINHWSNLSIYEFADSRDHFWLEDTTALHSPVVWQMINPTKHIVSVKNLNSPTTLVFSENFDSGWTATIDNKKITSQKVYDRLNSFPIERTGDVEVVVEFAPQKYVGYGLIISILTFTLATIILGYIRIYKIGS